MPVEAMEIDGAPEVAHARQRWQRAHIVGGIRASSMHIHADKTHTRG